MQNEKDYSEYQFSESQKYRAARRGNRYVDFDCFHNYARYSPRDKTIRISVDGCHEDASMREDIDAFNAEDAARREFHPEVLSPEEQAEREEARLDGLRENAEDRAQLCRRCGISLSPAGERIDLPASEEKEMPLHNVLSGEEIVLRYGEGILNFIYADFEPAFREARKLARLPELLLAGRPEWAVEACRARAAARRPEKVYNQTQEIVEEYFSYTSSRFFTKEISYCSLYTAICPPVFTDTLHADKALKRYCGYLAALQKEYRELMEFCFDEKYWPQVLGGLHPAERYYLCRELHGQPWLTQRSERFTFDFERMDGSVAPYGMSREALIRRVTHPVPVTDDLRAFAKQYGTDAERLSAELTAPHFLNISYEFHTVADALELEFTKLLESDVRFRKCERCGKYFIMKGNYDTRYCDRIAEGETRMCRDLAAQENYAAKNADNPAAATYRKYYKRYFARVQVRQIRADDFKRWKYQAVVKRDACLNGALTPEALTAWMEGAFPNRQKKK